jgi:hypothetical protein
MTQNLTSICCPCLGAQDTFYVGTLKGVGRYIRGLQKCERQLLAIRTIAEIGQGEEETACAPLGEVRRRTRLGRTLNPRSAVQTDMARELHTPCFCYA